MFNILIFNILKIIKFKNIVKLIKSRNYLGRARFARTKDQTVQKTEYLPLFSCNFVNYNFTQIKKDGIQDRY
jgi:hypothetical protein